MARPARPERSRSARSSRQLSRFYHSINLDRVFGTHTGLALGRDRVRTPMPWDRNGNAGFTTAKPWLPLNADWPTRNVARMTEESQSILTLYRRLLAVRRARLALSVGDFALLDGEGDVLTYERRHDAERLIVALNLGGRPHRLQLPDWARDCRLLLSTVDDAALAEGGSVDAAVAAIGRVGEIDRAGCRAAASARFTVDRMADRYLDLYRSILG